MALVAVTGKRTVSVSRETGVATPGCVCGRQFPSNLLLSLSVSCFLILGNEGGSA